MIAVALASLLAVQWHEPPDLAPGDRVRVHVRAEQQTIAGPTPRVLRARYSGTLTLYTADDGLALERDKLLGTYPNPAAVRFSWPQVSRIDVPVRGGNWLGGAARGGLVALMGGAAGWIVCAVGGNVLRDADQGCHFWKYTGRIALVTVPVGAIIGSRFTRWKPVYKQKR